MDDPYVPNEKNYEKAMVALALLELHRDVYRDFTGVVRGYVESLQQEIAELKRRLGE